MGFVYLIHNNVNRKMYVGQTRRTIAERWGEHRKEMLRPCMVLHRAINKYGKEAFTVSPLVETDSQQELDALECYWITLLETIGISGYNCKTGGGSPIYSDETRKRMSKKRSKPMSAEGRQNISLAQRGKKLSAETRLKMSLVRKGRPSSRRGVPIAEATKAKISAALIGKHIAKETCRKISASKLGHSVSEETRQKISIALAGRPGRLLTEETRQKLRAARARQAPITEETRAKMCAAQQRRHARG